MWLLNDLLKRVKNRPLPRNVASTIHLSTFQPGNDAFTSSSVRGWQAFETINNGKTFDLSRTYHWRATVSNCKTPC